MQTFLLQHIDEAALETRMEGYRIKKITLDKEEDSAVEELKRSGGPGFVFSCQAQSPQANLLTTSFRESLLWIIRLRIIQKEGRSEGVLRP